MSPIELVRARLEERGSRIVGDRGDSFTAQCPAHPDTTPSLHVSTGEDGRALLHDHGGCDLEAVLDALALDLPLLFEKRYKDKASLTHHVRPSPCPCITSEEEGRPELYDLLEASERGEIEPADVALGELPKQAGMDERLVAADLKLLLGLRRAEGDYRPLPYSVRFCCRRMGWREDRPMRASRVLRRLERWGVIDRTGTLPPRPDVAYRTKCYEPPLRVDAVERVPVAVEVEVQPAAEVLRESRGESRVDGTQAARGKEERMVAAGYGAVAVDGPTAASARTSLDFVQAGHDSPERGATWVGEGVVGRYVWQYDAVNEQGEVMAF